MKKWFGFLLVLFLFPTPGASQAQNTADRSAPGQGTRKPEPVQPGAKQGQATTEYDPIPKFNMEYFVGDWTFEGDIADSPLGEGGQLTGREIIRNVWDGRFWDVAIEGKEPNGKPFTGTGIFFYADTFAGQHFTRYEVTRGIATLKSGTLSCDMGMTCGLHYETPPFKHDGKLLRLKGRYQVTGAYSYRLFTEISVDKGEFTNLGSLWFHKDPKAPKPEAIK